MKPGLAYDIFSITDEILPNFKTLSHTGIFGYIISAILINNDILVVGSARIAAHYDPLDEHFTMLFNTQFVDKSGYFAKVMNGVLNIQILNALTLESICIYDQASDVWVNIFDGPIYNVSTNGHMYINICNQIIIQYNWPRSDIRKLATKYEYNPDYAEWERVPNTKNKGIDTTMYWMPMSDLNKGDDVI